MRLPSLVRVMVVTAGVAMLAAASPVYAQKAAAKPAAAKAKNEMRMPRTATARCGDSTWSKAASQQGACSSHGGVAKWFGKAPSNMTARCSDGEYWTNEERRGACSQHGGVAFWVGKSKSKKS
ncbi:MAG TPA: DUF3761 domain-containing protein [Gemmatimonadaceae bacterium]|nr:DUF3761 domain-containing protein [Gemmatimonadaceae bacterium]